MHCMALDSRQEVHTKKRRDCTVLVTSLRLHSVQDSLGFPPAWLTWGVSLCRDAGCLVRLNAEGGRIARGCIMSTEHTETK